MHECFLLKGNSSAFITDLKAASTLKDMLAVQHHRKVLFNIIHLNDNN